MHLFAPVDGRGGRSEFGHRVWPAHPRQLAPIRTEVRRWLEPLTLSGDAEQDLVLAVSEAASNAVEHAYPTDVPAGGPREPDGPTVELSFWTEEAAVLIEVRDHGRWRPPTPGPTDRGMGIMIMQRLVGSVMISYDDRGTRVLLRHPLPGAARRLPG